MKIRSPGSASRLRRPLRLATLGASAFLLALALACGAADRPQDPAPQASQAGQSSPSQPASQPRAAAETSPAQENPQENPQEMPQEMAKAEHPVAAESDELLSEPVASGETTVDHPSGSQLTMETKADVEVKVDQAAAPKQEPMAKAMDSHPATEPSSNPADPAASQQKSTGDMKEVAISPAGETPPEPTAEPQATEAPVVKEPLAEVGNQVGNRIPDFTLDLVGGATVSTANLIEEGKPAFLFFTSTT